MGELDETIEKRDNLINRKECLVTFLYQAIPWIIFIATFLIQLFVDLFVKDPSDETERRFTYAYLISLAALIIILVIGSILYYKNAQGKINFVILILFNLVFIGFSVTLTFSLQVQEKEVVILCIGLPLLILSLGHLLWSLLNKEFPINSIVSGILVILSAGVSIVCIIVSHRTDIRFGAFLASFVGLIQLLISSSWMTAVKHTLKIE